MCVCVWLLSALVSVISEAKVREQSQITISQSRSANFLSSSSSTDWSNWLSRLLLLLLFSRWRLKVDDCVFWLWAVEIGLPQQQQQQMLQQSDQIRAVCSTWNTQESWLLWRATPSSYLDDDDDDDDCCLLSALIRLTTTASADKLFYLQDSDFNFSRIYFLTFAVCHCLRSGCCCCYANDALPSHCCLTVVRSSKAQAGRTDHS
mgnify:CR=1 FL=1